MNKRIQELLDQAYTVSNDKHYPTVWWNGQDAFMATFAELMVQDCLAVIEKRMNLGTDERCREECKALIAEIKQQYGVE